MKVHEILGKRVPTTGILFGVECEVEGRQLPHDVPEGWRVEEDGSLRNGLEYVFDGPFEIDESKQLLKELFATFKKNKSRLDYSFRTSTHVHVNVNDLEFKQVLNIVFLYTLVEDLFTNYCEEHRRGNRFCLRFKDAQYLYNVVAQMASRSYIRGDDTGAMLTIDQGSVKYSALNLFTLQKYGTLEFRTLEGTNDLAKISLWLDTIKKLVEVGKRFATIEDLHSTFFNDPEAIIDEIFTEEFKFDGWKRSVEESYSQSYHIVMSSKGVL